MAGAIHMQARRPVRGRRAAWSARAVALGACVALLLTVLGALRHETTVAHVRDAVSGELRHAHALAERHTADTAAHVHGREVEADAEAGACQLLASLDHAALVSTPAGALARPTPLAPAAALAAAAVLDPRSRYRLAPKTSPPARA